jgi:transposase-like protein
MENCCTWSLSPSFVGACVAGELTTHLGYEKHALEGRRSGNSRNGATNAIESLSMSLRKAIKTRGAFPSEEAALKVMYLALRNLSAKWQSIQGWKDALNHKPATQ